MIVEIDALTLEARNKLFSTVIPCEVMIIETQCLKKVITIAFRPTFFSRRSMCERDLVKCCDISS